MAKYIIASTKLNDDGTVHSVSHPIEVDSDMVNTIKIFDKIYVKQKHGHWINDKGLYRCSVCNNFTNTGWANCIPIEYMNKTMKYCNNCGARMDGEEDGTDR